MKRSSDWLLGADHISLVSINFHHCVSRLSFIMNTAATLRSTYWSTVRRQISISTCLFSPHQPIRHVSTAPTTPPPSAEPTPTPLDHPPTAKRRASLSEEQQRFLDSAVCRPLLNPPESSSHCHLSLSDIEKRPMKTNSSTPGSSSE